MSSSQLWHPSWLWQFVDVLLFLGAAATEQTASSIRTLLQHGPHRETYNASLTALKQGSSEEEGFSMLWMLMHEHIMHAHSSQQSFNKGEGPKESVNVQHHKNSEVSFIHVVLHCSDSESVGTKSGSVCEKRNGGVRLSFLQLYSSLQIRCVTKKRELKWMKTRVL